jgi:hypothetical protein
MTDGTSERAVSRYASLLETTDGYEVHRRGRATFEMFPSTQEGFDAAWDRYAELTHAGRTARLLSALVVVGVVAAALWFVVTLVSAVLYVAAFQNRSGGSLGWLISSVSAVTTVLYALFAGAVGCDAAVWLYRRGMPPAPTPRR